MYNSENKSDEVVALWNKSTYAITSILTYAEIMAVLGRKMQDKAITKSEYDKIIIKFDNDWKSFIVVDYSSSIFKLTKDLTAKYYLRGFDAVHLASAKYWIDIQEDKKLIFSCYDNKLLKAAEKEKLIVSYMYTND